MKSTHICIVAGTIGVLIGAASMYFIVSEDSRATVFDGSKQLEELLARMDQMESTLLVMKGDISASASQISTGFSKVQQAQIAANGRAELQSAEDTKDRTSVVAQDAAANGKPAIADDEETVQVIESRLRDPGYIYSTTLPEVMQSEDMARLSPESRARVVAEMVGMINRGEIDAKYFVSSPKNGQ